jgi:hypothetical protein
MPASYVVDVDVRIWELLEAGDIEGARRVHRDKMVLETIKLGMPAQVAGKEILVRRGVISCNAVRNAGPHGLDATDLTELEYGLSVVEPYFAI